MFFSLKENCETPYKGLKGHIANCKCVFFVLPLLFLNPCAVNALLTVFMPMIDW